MVAGLSVGRAGRNHLAPADDEVTRASVVAQPFDDCGVLTAVPQVCHTANGNCHAGVLYLLGSHRDYRPFRDEHSLDPLEGIGAGGYVVTGLAALVSGTPFLTNLFGRGQAGTLLSGGSIGVLNAAAGLAVTLAMLLLFAEFLETYVVPLEPEDAAS